ncbi:hypothetical protein TWF694_009342 [Orbilia ellipsospora]|uniref:Uncharacterized protein n=1 Tax=Orbilia ellipsospora TaxID=2528407 RepID=A0AAV9XFW1_9PEZI
MEPSKMLNGFLRRHNPLRYNLRPIRRRTRVISDRLGLKGWTIPLLFPIFNYLFSYIQESESIDTDFATQTEISKNIKSKITNLLPQSSKMNPLFIIFAMINDLIDAITHGVSDAIYSITYGIPLIDLLVYPFDLILRVRIHVEPRRSILNQLFKPLRHDCYDFTSFIIISTVLYYFCRPFRRFMREAYSRIKNCCRYLKDWRFSKALNVLWEGKKKGVASSGKSLRSTDESNGGYSQQRDFRDRDRDYGTQGPPRY